MLWLQGSLFLLPTAAILFSGGLEGPAGQDWELRHWAAAKTRLEQRPMTEGPRRYASQAHRNFLIYFFPTGHVSVLSVVRKQSRGRETLHQAKISLWLQGSLFLLPSAAILFSGGLEGPAGQDRELRHRAAAKTGLEQRPMTEDPRRNAS